MSSKLTKGFGLPDVVPAAVAKAGKSLAAQFVPLNAERLRSAAAMEVPGCPTPVLTHRNLQYFLASPLYFGGRAEPVELTKTRPISKAILTVILEGTEAFMGRFQVADIPVNPSTGKPYGIDTKTVTKWAEQAGIDLEVAITTEQTVDIHQISGNFHADDAVREVTKSPEPFCSMVNVIHDVPSIFAPIQMLDKDGLPVYIRTIQSMDDLYPVSMAAWWREAVALQFFTVAHAAGSADGKVIKEVGTVGTIIALEENFPYRIRVLRCKITEEVWNVFVDTIIDFQRRAQQNDWEPRPTPVLEDSLFMLRAV